MKKNDTIELQNQIIQRQKKMIADLEEKLESFQANIELEKYFSEPAYADVASLIKELENQKIVFDDAIKRARQAEQDYKDLLAEAEPFVKDYKKKVKKMTSTVDKFIPRK